MLSVDSQPLLEVLEVSPSAGKEDSAVINYH